MHIHMLRGEDGQERLEDLELDPLVSVRPREAGADGVHDHINLPLGRVLHTDTGPGEVTIGYQLLYPIQGNDNQSRCLALTRQAAILSESVIEVK